MKKLLVFVLVLGLLGGGGFLVYTMMLKPKPAKAFCADMVRLCGDGDAGKKITERCQSAVDKLIERGNKKAVEDAAKCAKDAKTCAAATGCVVGVGVKAAAGAVGEFFKGLKNAVKSK